MYSLYGADKIFTNKLRSFLILIEYDYMVFTSYYTIDK